MRVLFTTTPGWGHVHPMVPLAKAFQERGDDVAWAAASELAPRLEKAGFQVFPAGLGGMEAFAEVQRHSPEINEIRHNSTRRGFPLLFGWPRIEPMLKDLSGIAADWQPSLIVHEQSELAAPIVGTASGVPYATHSFGEVVPLENLDPDGLGVTSLWQAHGLDAPAFAGCHAHMYLDIYPPSLHSVDMADFGLVQPIRPVPFATAGAEHLPEWIATDSRPLIYVTFGTVFNDRIDVIRTVVDGVRTLDARVLVTVGPHADPATLGPQPANVHVARYVPQTQVLPHCSAVISHAGSGTFLGALSEGVPQVCVPQGADQFVNAKACAAAGLGRTLEPEEVTVERVRASTEEVLSDPSFRVAAQKIQVEMAAMPDPAAVAEVMAAALVETVGAPS